MSSTATGSAPRGAQRVQDAAPSVSMYDAGRSSPVTNASEEEDAGARPIDAGTAPATTGAPVAGERAVSEFVAAATAALRTRGKGGNDAELKRWRNEARNSTRLTPEVVTPALSRIAESATCFVRPQECVSVCLAMEQDCEPCLNDSTCKAVLLQVCSTIPGGICGI